MMMKKLLGVVSLIALALLAGLAFGIMVGACRGTAHVIEGWMAP